MRFFRFLYNKYFLTALAFVVFMTFFDQNDWFSQRDRKAQLEEINGNISFLNRRIDTLNGDYEALRHDPAALERYAREHYRMKRDSEDLFIVEPKQ
ncbi:MAG: septum formation initiator family protein [Bacteroidetes bacterium]|nr:septum formation initiator family protein [Bacteroidota bacterium]MBS1629733.1 septum formation initiator family protein [Bacteroidota bacterium]